MGSLTSCIKKAGKALSGEDKTAIVKAASRHRAGGMSNADASMRAVEEQIEAIKALIVTAGGDPAESVNVPKAGTRAAANDEAGPGVATPPILSQSSQTDTPEFKAWFGDSVVTKNGKAGGEPLVVYHGSGVEFDTFDAGRLGENTGYGDAEVGFHFSDNRADADFYASKAAERLGKYNGVIRPFYLSLKTPLIVGVDETDGNAGGRTQDFLDDKTAAKSYAEANGHDGIVYLHGTNVDSGYTAIAFRPEQIKSAIGNRGTFDPNNPSILLSQTAESAITADRPFYSQLSKEIARSPMNAGTAGAWKQYLKSLASKGVKPDEITWSGIEEWLDLQQGKITKAQIGEYLDANGVKVEEVTLGGKGEARSALDFLDADTSTETKYSQYTLPGGENYREVLLTLPAAKRKPRFDVVNRKDKSIIHKAESRDAAQSWIDSHQGMPAARGAEIVERQSGQPEAPEYKSSHWDQPNVLAHIRLNDRVDADGARVLFVEELQSDWGQERKKNLRMADESGSQMVRDGADAKTPNAPFIDTTDKWLTLGLKRIIKMAVDGGYDKVAFVTGEQSAARYDLSKQVNMVKAIKTQGGFDLFFEDSTGRQHDVGIKTADELPDVVGKELASKIVNDGGGTYRGLDLKVGGEGMIAFYDRIVPAATNALLKKVGGVKIETVDIRPFDPNGLGRMLQPGFTITDTMRERAAGGLPLFANAAKLQPGTAKASIQAMVDASRASWSDAPPVTVVDSVDGLPTHIQDAIASQGATGTVRALVMPDTGRVYLIADRLKSVDEAQFVLFHEVLGHYGMRKFLGDKYAPEIDKLRKANPALAKEAMRWFQAYGQGHINARTSVGMDFTQAVREVSLLSVEEALADRAGDAKPLSGFKAFMAKVQAALRNIGLGKVADMLEGMTEAETFALLAHARRAVESGPARESFAIGLNGPLNQQAFHGTPYRGIEKFSTDKIGTGEGAQAFGWGLYFTDKREIAEYYRETLGKGRFSINGVPFEPGNYYINELVGRHKGSNAELSEKLRTYAQWNKDSPFAATDDALKIAASIDDGTFEAGSLGQLYKVEIPDDSDMLLWDKTLGQQPEKVLKALKDSGIAKELRDNLSDYASPMDTRGKLKGENIYAYLRWKLGSERAASERLRELGILGTNYPAGTIAGNTNTKARNYVIFSGEDVRDIRPLLSQPDPVAESEWGLGESSRLDDLIFNYQDKQVDLRRSIQAIRTAGREIEDRFDAYLQEELYHGRSAKRVEDFASLELAPLLKDMAARGITQERLDKYLLARHAKNANEHVAKINRKPDHGQIGIDGKPVESPLQDGGSGMKTADAQEFLDGLDPAEKKRLEAVASKVDAIIAKNRALVVSYALESADTVDGWSQMFEHYVPLMREDEGGGMGTGQGFSIRGKEAKHRTGSTAKVVDILANIAMQRERTIVRGEKNRVVVALAGLVYTNPNPDLWSLVPTKERYLNESTGLVETRDVPNLKSLNNVVVAKIRANDGSVQERAIVFNEKNERAQRMAAALKNLDAAQVEGVLTLIQPVTRYMASINTQYNPIFGIVNFTRDVQGALLNLGSTEIAGERSRVAAEAAGLFGQVLKAGFRLEKSDASALWSEYQDEGGQTGFRELFRTSKDRARDIEKQLDPDWWTKTTLGKIATVGGLASTPMSAAHQAITAPLFDWLSDYNTALENVVRMAAYKVAREKGISKQRAASLAKNLTVNFNRKGSKSPGVAALYAFFNASVQGTARLGQTLVTMEGGDIKTMRLSKTGKQIVAGGVLLGVLQAIALHLAGYDDDNPPEYVRERNFIIPLGERGKYITIPMPLGFHVLPGIGRIAAEYFLSGGKDPGKRIGSIASMLMGTFNPIGGGASVLQTITPTFADPIAAIAENKDFTGSPISRTTYSKNEPGFRNAKDTATPWGKFIAEAVNTLSGGGTAKKGALSPTPDDIDYLIGQATGGVGREVGKVAEVIAAAKSGEVAPPNKIPLLGRFFGDVASSSGQARQFYAHLEKIREATDVVKTMRKDIRDGTNGTTAEDLKAHFAESKLLPLYREADALAKRLKGMRQDRRKHLEAGNRARVAAIEEDMRKIMTDFNDKVRAMEKRSAGVAKPKELEYQ